MWNTIFRIAIGLIKIAEIEKEGVRNTFYIVLDINLFVLLLLVFITTKVS